MADKLIPFQKRVRRRLPVQMKHVWTDYLAFCQETPPQEAKAFSAHQQACKNALAHLLVLMKLAALMGPTSAPVAEETDWIRAAQTALAQTEETEDDC